jgi:hypothetical protein
MLPSMRLLTLSVALALAACSPPPPPDDAPDATPDATPPDDTQQPDGAADEGPREAGVDAGPEASPDAADAAADAPVDTGPVYLDLAEIRSTERFAGTLRTNCTGPTCRELVWDVQASGSTCRDTGSAVEFSVRVCARGVAGLCDTVTGTQQIFLPPPPSSVASGPSVPWRADYVGGMYGPRYTEPGGTRRRRNFLAQVSGPEGGSNVAVMGIPGVTIDPLRGDIWLLGCAN